MTLPRDFLPDWRPPAHDLALLQGCMEAELRREDLGVLLDPNVGRLKRANLTAKPRPDYYVVPAAVLAEWVAEGRRPTGRGQKIYLMKRACEPGSKEARGQRHELKEYANRFQELTGRLA